MARDVKTTTLVAGIMAAIIVAGIGTSAIGILAITGVYPGTAGTSTCISVMGYRGAFLRILSDSTQTPVAGAVVTATLNPISNCYVEGMFGETEYITPSTTSTTFTTNGTMWTPLNTTNGHSISLTVKYSGQSYKFTVQLDVLFLTCTTLYVPSGRMNTTTTIESTCP